MRTQQGLRAQLKSRQGGAVAIIVAVSLVALIGMLGLVLDLGHLYVTKTELQNAADAASLSGAKELNGKLTGINNAITRAVEAAGKNKYNLNSTVLVISSSNIRVGTCPDASCMVPITSITTDALASNKTFLEVNTGSHGLRTWFAQVLSAITSDMQVSAVAVAGKYAANITPIAICRIDDPGTTNEFGYERGVTYNIAEANPIGPGTLFWIDPESNTPGVCTATSTNDTTPYICGGKTAYTPVIGGTVNTNTGISGPQLDALNSRFNLYGSGGNACDPTIAPPDTNIKQYPYTPSGSGSPASWMGTDPIRQGIKFVEKADLTKDCKTKNTPCRSLPYSMRSNPTDYGVLWSRYRPDGKTVTDWSTLYSGNTATSYPETSPYAQTSSPFFSAPTSHPGVAGRRELNMLIVECASAGGVCRPATVLGVGKFFMQTQADTASKDIYVEFGGLLSTPLPPSDIKLYR